MRNMLNEDSRKITRWKEYGNAKRSIMSGPNRDVSGKYRHCAYSAIPLGQDKDLDNPEKHTKL
jgi:hypothetical protein